MIVPKKYKSTVWYERTKKLKSYILRSVVRRASILKSYIIKGVLIVSICATSIVAPITLPIFIAISLWTGSISYMIIPFLILDLKTIVTFIIEN